MKHTKCITSAAPVQCAEWQEFVCTFAVAINAILSFMGGSSPITLYIEDKCDIPQPNDS